MNDRIMLKPTVLIALVLFSVSALFANPTPPDKAWEHLGTKKIKRANDKDVVYVDNYGEWFSAIELRTNNQHVDLHRVVIHYEDGSKQDVSLDQNYLGEEYHTIGLDGGNHRAVDKIAIYGSGDRKSKVNSAVEVWGKVGGDIQNSNRRIRNNGNLYNYPRYRTFSRFGRYGGYHSGLRYRRGLGFGRFCY